MNQDQTNENELASNQRFCPNPQNYKNCKGKLTYLNEDNCKKSEKLNKICLNCAQNLRYLNNPTNNIQRLLSDELDSFYWMGFLLADGSFGKNGGFGLQLAQKDFDHLKKFVDYISYQNKIFHTIDSSFNVSTKVLKSNSICIGGCSDIINEIKQKFDIIPPKTYNPPNIEIFKNFTEDQIYSLIIGYIDGDGCIFRSKNSKRSIIKFYAHYSWKLFIEFIINFLGDTSRVSVINNKLSAGIGKTEIVNRLKQKMLSLNLPVLDRKWNKIDLSYDGTFVKKSNKFERFKELIESGYTNTEIITHLNIEPISLYYYIRKLKS